MSGPNHQECTGVAQFILGNIIKLISVMILVLPGGQDVQLFCPLFVSFLPGGQCPIICKSCFYTLWRFFYQHVAENWNTQTMKRAGLYKLDKAFPHTRHKLSIVDIFRLGRGELAFWRMAFYINNSKRFEPRSICSSSLFNPVVLGKKNTKPNVYRTCRKDSTKTKETLCGLLFYCYVFGLFFFSSYDSEA